MKRWVVERSKKKGEKERKKSERPSLHQLQDLTSSLSISLLSFLGETPASPASARALAWNNARLEPESKGVAIDACDARSASAPASLLSASARSLVAARMLSLHPLLGEHEDARQRKQGERTERKRNEKMEKR